MFWPLSRVASLRVPRWLFVFYNCFVNIVILIYESIYVAPDIIQYTYAPILEFIRETFSTDKYISLFNYFAISSLIFSALSFKKNVFKQFFIYMCIPVYIQGFLGQIVTYFSALIGRCSLPFAPVKYAEIPFTLLNVLILYLLAFTSFHYIKPFVNFNKGKIWHYAVFSVLLYFARWIIANLSQHDPATYAAPILLITLLFFATIMVVLDRETKRKYQLEKQQLIEQNHYQYEYFKSLEEQQREIRRMRHDISNQISILSSLSVEEATMYTKELAERYKAIPVIDYCQNRIVNVILTNKSKLAKEKEIDFDVSVSLPVKISFDELNLSSIFSNLIDNAIEAAERSENKTISVHSSIKLNGLAIVVENSYSENESIPTGFMKSTKSYDPLNHGIGVGVVQDIVSRCSGSMTFEKLENIFRVSVFIPLPEHE